MKRIDDNEDKNLGEKKAEKFQFVSCKPGCGCLTDIFCQRARNSLLLWGLVCLMSFCAGVGTYIATVVSKLPKTPLLVRKWGGAITISPTLLIEMLYQLSKPRS